MKVAVSITRTHNPFDEDYWASCLRENLTSSSYGEGLETGREFAQEPRQSFTRQMYFKVLKSGFRVEACRLGHADRLARYLTVMSIVAWRLFMITLIARTDPAAPCTTLLADHEWKVLFLKANRNKAVPKKLPSIGEVVIWVAKLGGYLARKSDGPPGTITLWRGWKRLADLSEGWTLAAKA